jgi:N-methylhydantoinase B/oxoprolinase/acetone carboxylase alpha subunit
LKKLIVDFLERNDYFEVETAGVIIETEKGVKNKKLRPYTYKNCRRKGRCKLFRHVTLFLKDTNEKIGSATLKKDAKALAKQLIRKYQKDIYAKTIYMAADDDLDFELTYIPSYDAKTGVYKVFGIEKADVNQYRKSKAEI